MCGISGAIIRKADHKYYDLLRASDIRGQDGTGICILRDGQFIVHRWDERAQDVLVFPELKVGDAVIGQNRLAIFGMSHENDQPLLSENTALVHNGALFNYEPLFAKYGLQRLLQVDSELILRLYDSYRMPTMHTIDMPGGVWSAITRVTNIISSNSAWLLLDKSAQAIVASSFDKPLWNIEHPDDGNMYFFSTDRIGKRVFGEDLVDRCAHQYALKEGSITGIKGSVSWPSISIS